MPMNWIEFDVLNWEKYNPKRAQQTYTWLRLDNDFVTDPELFGLDAEQKLVWVFILCQASKRNSGRIRLALSFLEHATQVKGEKIEALISFLQEKPIIRLVNAHSLHQTTPACSESVDPLHLRDERTNERTNVSAAPARAEPEASPGPSPEPGPPPRKPDPLTREDIRECCDTFRETLRKFGAGRTLLSDEETQIGRAIQRYGKNAVVFALEGARHEPKDERFDPGKFLNLRRILADESFTRFLNLGVQARHREQPRASPGLALVRVPSIATAPA